MRTPPMRRRVVLYGTIGTLAVLLVVQTAIFAGLASVLYDHLADLLEARMVVARGLAEDVAPDELAGELQRAGVPAQVREPDGRLTLSAVDQPRFGQLDAREFAEQRALSSVLETDDGTRVTVYASTVGVDTTLLRLGGFMLAGLAIASVFAIVLWRRSHGFVLGPIGEMASTAERIAEGAHAIRLEPDEPDSELGRLAAAFDNMIDALEAARVAAEREEVRTREFLDDVAHQLRTPLAALLATAEQAIHEDDRAQRESLLTNLVQEGGRAARLVNGLLRLARLERVPLDCEPTDLRALAAREAVRARRLSPHLRVTVSSAAPTPVVAVDPAATGHALANLLDNARRHAVTAVVVHVDDDGDRVMLRVTDDGPGIPASERTRVLERFVTLDGHGGSGLGIPIARAVARAHGGDLTIGAGAVTLTFPRIIPASPAQGVAGADETRQAAVETSVRDRKAVERPAGSPRASVKHESEGPTTAPLLPR